MGLKALVNGDGVVKVYSIIEPTLNNLVAI